MDVSVGIGDEVAAGCSSACVAVGGIAQAAANAAINRQDTPKKRPRLPGLMKIHCKNLESIE